MKTHKKASGIPVYCKYDKIVAISDLIPNPENPNQHPAEQIELLANIIQGNGWRDRIVVSNLSGMIVKGHGRYQAAVLAGLYEVPVEYQDYASEADEVRDLIADNKIAELSEINNDEAQALIENLADVDIDFRSFGFSTEEIETINQEYIKAHEKKGEEKPEIEFSEELLLEHNYIVLYFDNPLDWIVAVDKFGLKKVKDLIPRKGQPTGIGRVLDGVKWLDRIK